MKNLSPKLIIILLCSYTVPSIYFGISSVHFSSFSIADEFIMVFLISIIFSFLLEIFSLKIRLSIYLLFILSCFINSLFLYFSPLIFYDIYFDFKRKTLFLLIPFVFLSPFLPTAVLSGIILYLSYRERQSHSLSVQNIHLRDTYRENLLREETHRQQIESEREKDIQIAILGERNRIAREIHDAIGHTLSSGILQVEALKLTLDQPIYNKQFDTLKQTLQSGMFDVRRSLHHLHSSAFCLQDELNQLTESPFNLQIELTYQADEKIMDYPLKYSLYSVIKEALTNVTKHSDATMVKIRLMENPDYYALTIKDNGRSFMNPPDPDQVLKPDLSGMGILAMDELARKYNGNLNYGFHRGFFIHMILKKEQKNENHPN